MLKVYGYKNCSTCRNAIKWLRERKIFFAETAIRESPPTVTELKAMLVGRGGNLRELFNTSGQDYRELNLKDRLRGLSSDDAIALLAGNGNLIKRPFVLDESRGVFLVGFREPEWQAVLGQ